MAVSNIGSGGEGKAFGAGKKNLQLETVLRGRWAAGLRPSCGASSIADGEDISDACKASSMLEAREVTAK